ncbi:M57 family metalloprotease [Cystobacter fuscus]|uniref:M57 family metalloprotease n=1 Tax=Cystobacter fuscus TaxID=43 RepID=UPI0037BFFEFC
MTFGCSGQPDETQEIVGNLVKAGFPANDIMIVDGKVYVGRDAEVSLGASREMLGTGDTTQEQYRTNNLISTSLSKICINGSTFTGAFSTALDLAIQNYDELPLTFAMARTPSTGCSFTINAVLQPGMVGGSAGFPSGGLPYSTINIGAGLASYSVDVIEHVITHEIGHTIGFRHTDYYNRSISCGSGGNEGDAGVGAIHIPGTPTTANVGGSIMNSCFRSAETGEFASSDITALKALYLAQNSAWQSAPQFTPPFHLSSDTVGDLGGRFVDLNGDGRADLAYYRWIDGSNQQMGAYLNTGSGWQSAPQFTPPFHITSDTVGDLGARFADLNGDGRADLAYYRWIDGSNQQMGAYLNTGSGWQSAPQFTPPFHITADSVGWLGAAFADLNGDGRDDFAFYRWIDGSNQQTGAYLNTGSGWQSAPQFTPPFHLSSDTVGDLGGRFVDLNGDGRADFAFYRWIDGSNQQAGAYLNTGSGWQWAPQFTPPFHITADSGVGDLGARFADLNGDGRADLAYYRWIDGANQQTGAYLNTGNGWEWAPQFTPPFHITADSVGWLGAVFADLDGDGRDDFAFHRWIDGANQQTGAYLLK